MENTTGAHNLDDHNSPEIALEREIVCSPYYQNRKALMTNTEMQILDFSNCWIFDRYIANDASTATQSQEFAFDWLGGFGIYQDFELLNQQIPGFSTRTFQFVARRISIQC